MIRHRDGTEKYAENGQDKVLSFLYGNVCGRFVLKGLTAPWISRVAGAFMNSRLSCVMIKPFIRRNNINMADYEEGPFKCYNAFFARHIRDGARKVDMEKSHLISPADSKLTVIPVDEKGVFFIKHTAYTVASLFQSTDVARRFDGGQLLIFRLTVDDYHRYCYMVDGEKEENVFIPGRLHTVNPIANDFYPIYKENAREYTIVHTDDFGDMAVMEVGALMVGKIRNHHGAQHIRRGDEKGYFEFGGSTVCVLLQKGAAVMDEDIMENSRHGIETVVRMGERIGCK